MDEERGSNEFCLRGIYLGQVLENRLKIVGVWSWLVKDEVGRVM